MWVELLSFVKFTTNANFQDSSGLGLRQLVFGKVLRAPVDLHPIEAALSWVFEVKDVVK